MLYPLSNLSYPHLSHRSGRQASDSLTACASGTSSVLRLGDKGHMTGSFCPSPGKVRPALAHRNLSCYQSPWLCFALTHRAQCCVPVIPALQDRLTKLNKHLQLLPPSFYFCNVFTNIHTSCIGSRQNGSGGKSACCPA